MAIFLVLVLFLTGILFGDESVNTLTENDGSSYNYLSDFFHMLFTLGFVLILIFVSVWVLKKILRSRMHNLNKTNGIKILERRPLNPKASLYLVDILGKGVVISESPSGIQLITEFPPDVKVDALFEQIQEENYSPSTLKESFLSKFKKSAAKPHGG